VETAEVSLLREEAEERAVSFRRPGLRLEERRRLADDPLVFKKLVYEMRFDPASSRYALFGPFYTGIRFAPAALGDVLRAGVPSA
jgi:hypothetical protein